MIHKQHTIQHNNNAEILARKQQNRMVLHKQQQALFEENADLNKQQDNSLSEFKHAEIRSTKLAAQSEKRSDKADVIASTLFGSSAVIVLSYLCERSKSLFDAANDLDDLLKKHLDSDESSDNFDATLENAISIHQLNPLESYVLWSNFISSKYETLKNNSSNEQKGDLLKIARERLQQTVDENFDEISSGLNTINQTIANRRGIVASDGGANATSYHGTYNRMLNEAQRFGDDCTPLLHDLLKASAANIALSSRNNAANTTEFKSQISNALKTYMKIQHFRTLYGLCS